MIYRLTRPILIAAIGSVFGAKEPYPDLQASRKVFLQWLERNAPNVLTQIKGD